MKDSQFYVLLAAGDIASILEYSNQGQSLTKEQSEQLRAYTKHQSKEEIQKRQFEVTTKPGWAESQLTPALVKVMSSLRNTFQPKVEEKKEEEKKGEHTVEVAKVAPKKKASAKKTVNNSFYTTISQRGAMLKRGDSLANIASKTFILVKKQYDDKLTKNEMEKNSYKKEYAEKLKEERTYTRQKIKEKTKDKSKKGKGRKLLTADNVMLGVALLIFSKEAEAGFSKMKDMIEDFSENIKNAIKPPKDFGQEVSVENIPTTPSDSEPFKGSQKEFYDKMYSTLLQQAKLAGVENPEVIARLGAAQSALETGFGKHVVGNNYFGIKAKVGMPSVEAETTEATDQGLVKVKQKFRAYGSMSESGADYIKFLQENKSYKPVLQSKTTEEAISKIGRYATATNYSQAVGAMHAKGVAGTLSDIPMNRAPVKVASATPEVKPVPKSTAGQNIDYQSRPLSTESTRPKIYTFVHEMDRYYVSKDVSGTTIFEDNYYEPKPELVSR
jgi:flagellum-specific peptidoglycan hydrolase FlgJ